MIRSLRWNPKERHPLAEITFTDVYSKATEILNLYGHPGTSPTLLVIPRLGRPRITSGADIPITEVPIVPIQIADNDYRLWLRSTDDRPSDIHNGEIKLSVHFQRLPLGLDRIEYDSEGYVTGYWYRKKDELEVQHHIRLPKSHFLPKELPKELDFSWYIAKALLIEPHTSSSDVPKNVPPEIVASLGDSNDFLLTILEEMQTKLETKSD